MNESFRRLVAVATRPIFGADPREISFLFTLFYLAASGDERHPGTFERNFSTRNGAQMWRFHGGSQLITQRMASRLGHRVVLGTPVRRIVQRQHYVTVESARRDIRAKRVIVAVPPTLAGRIHYQPEMPTARDQLTQRLPQGTLIKVACVYDTPFWREDGLNGTALSLNGPVNATFDDSPPGGRPGVIFGFVGGDAARGFMRLTAAERRAAVIRNFRRCFGPKASPPASTSRPTGPGRSGRAAVPSRSRGRGSWSHTVRRLGARLGGSTGWGRRRPRTGTATWTGRPLRRARRQGDSARAVWHARGGSRKHR